MSKKVTLVPIVRRRASSDLVRAPSQLRPEVELSQDEFDEVADTGSASLVSLDDDGISNPQQITAYTLPIKVQGGARGWIGRYIIKYLP